MKVIDQGQPFLEPISHLAPGTLFTHKETHYLTTTSHTGELRLCITLHSGIPVELPDTTKVLRRSGRVLLDP